MAFSLLLAASVFAHSVENRDTGDLETEENGRAEARIRETLAFAKSEFSAYRFHVASDVDAELTLKPEPILRWTNPVSGQVYGGVFVWTRRGRPEVVASFFRYYSPRRYWATEFHSLSTTRIVAERNDRDVWATSAAVALQPIPQAPPPAKSVSGRLVQMRGLARQFSAQRTLADGAKQQLRLLPRPNHRYSSSDLKILDGGLFTFAEGTNPELILLIEARRDDGRQQGWRWQYGLARQTRSRLDVAYRQKQVLTFSRLSKAEATDRTAAYTVFYGFPD